MERLKEVNPFILTLVLVGILLAVGLTVLQTFANSTAPSTSVVNETFTMPALNGNITLANRHIESITLVTNSSGITFPAANYTLWDARQARVQFLDNTSVCKTGQLCNISYTYENFNATAPNAVLNTSDALAEISNNWLLIIVVVFIAGFVVFVIVNALGVKDR